MISQTRCCLKAVTETGKQCAARHGGTVLSAEGQELMQFTIIK